jgi:hypothetical protein
MPKVYAEPEIYFCRRVSTWYCTHKPIHLSQLEAAIKRGGGVVAGLGIPKSGKKKHPKRLFRLFLKVRVYVNPEPSKSQTLMHME